MHHVPGAGNRDALVVCNSGIALLFVRAARLTALCTIDQKHWRLDPPQEFESLRGIERLRRDRAVERIEFPDPLASIVLFHRGASDLQSRALAQTRISLAQLASRPPRGSCTRENVGDRARAAR